MKVSKQGLALIKKWEGCILKAYKDVVGVWTIGYGITTAAGLGTIKPGMVITQKEADDMLVKALVKYENTVLASLKRVPTQNQFDAMVSLCYNIGQGAFAKSTVVKRFNDGNIEGAKQAFSMWRKAGGKVVQGLVNRRKDEMVHFGLKTASAADLPLEDITLTPAPSAPSLWDRFKALFKFKIVWS